MKRLLHIIATPRGRESRTLKISRTFLDRVRSAYPDAAIDELDLFQEELPPLTVTRVGGKYVLLGGGELTGAFKESWEQIEAHILRFLAADAYLVSTPMWNFGISYRLKHYIDIIVQPRYLFQYTEEGPEGLVKNRSMVVISSRGGDYSPDSPAHAYDQLEPYLRTVFGFVGIEDLTFVNAQPMDAAGDAVREQKIGEAIDAVKRLRL
ncbi:MAG: NAD(P)H-dependent oxidoreductase [bacterium]|nr:NAD(P)H-dependent oxidoreductase [bacterium]